MMRSIGAAVVVLLLTLMTAAAAIAQPVTISLDATDIARRTLHSRLTIPVTPGPLTLRYPKWIPGEHGPTGPIVDLVGVRVTAGGTNLPWQRDAADVFDFNVVVPPGVNSIDVALDFLTPVSGGKFSSGASITSQLAVLSWNTALLYPAGRPATELQYQATLRYPPTWKHATALRPTRESAGEVTFAPVSLVTLIDSPVLIGAHMTTVALTRDAIPHEIDIAADSGAALELPEKFSDGYERLVAETGAIFGARPYSHYHWLVSLSDSIEHFGLEHHESSDNRMGERTLLEERSRKGLASLLAHEFAHSWNGKYRRPADMVRADYQEPLQTELLWVYEGLTSFLGALLPTRSGLWEAEHFRESLAQTAAELDTRPGRSWRALSDTATSAQILFGAPSAWASYRRGADFYAEMNLVWLEADTIIRQKSGGRRSLDDFMRAFHGGQNGAPAVKTYTFEELVRTLNGVAENDWASFFKTRIRDVAPRAPLAGIENAGWRLVYSDKPNTTTGGADSATDWRFSLGLSLGSDGHVNDALPGLPAATAGISPGMKIIAIDGRRYTGPVLKTAVRDAKSSGKPIELLVEQNDFFTTYQVPYSGGERYPHLERIEGKPDVLSQILAPKAPPASKKNASN